MLLTDFKEVIAIDERINKLHSELNTLYEERMAITNSTNSSTATTQSTIASKTTESPTTWEQEQYEILRTDWMMHSVVIPTYKALRSKLTSAKVIMSKLDAANDNFELFLSPPASKMSFPTDDQAQSSYQGFNDTDMPKLPVQKQWKLYIVYKKSEGMPVDSYEEFRNGKQYSAGGYDMRGLNLREYGLYTLLQNAPIDNDTWSLLPAHSTPAEQQVVCAGYIDNQYRCVIDDTRSLLGENSFRPAMEVK